MFFSLSGFGLCLTCFPLFLFAYTCMGLIMYLSCRVSSLPPPNQQKENKTTQLFHARTYSANSYTLNIDNTRHTHTTILQLYMYIPKCLYHFLGVALCTGTCMYSSHGNDVECTLCDKFIRTCMYVRALTCTCMYSIQAVTPHSCATTCMGKGLLFAYCSITYQTTLNVVTSLKLITVSPYLISSFPCFSLHWYY